MIIGIALLLLGICAIAGGIIFIKKDLVSQKNEPNREAPAPKPPEQSEDKQKGDDFEKFVVQKFSKKYFTLLDWAGDKYVNGTYAQSSTHPDLTIKFELKDVAIEFAVECKYRSDYYKNGVEWCTERQLQNYKAYAAQKGKTVFVVIGIGGIATEPAELYVVPLSEMNDIFISKSALQAYKKTNFKEKGFYLDYQRNSLL